MFVGHPLFKIHTSNGPVKIFKRKTSTQHIVYVNTTKSHQLKQRLKFHHKQKKIYKCIDQDVDRSSDSVLTVIL